MGIWVQGLGFRGFESRFRVWGLGRGVRLQGGGP